MSDIPSIRGSYPAIQPFVFNTVGSQTAANAVYFNVSTTGATTFKDDYSRMQYLLGKNAVDPNACNAANNCKR